MLNKAEISAIIHKHVKLSPSGTMIWGVAEATDDLADALSSIPAQPVAVKPSAPLHSFKIAGQCNCIACLTVRRDHAEAKEAALPAPSQQEGVTEALKRLIRAYVSLMETGRDRIIQLGGTCDPVDVMERGDPYLRDAKAALEAALVDRGRVKP